MKKLIKIILYLLAICLMFMYKDEIISKIINSMNMAGEFSFGDISISERIDIMQNVKNKLNSKSMEELQILLSTYQFNQEETQRHAARR